ncbi:hypothetical protein P154DRAFT_540930 [Amniculicola lignicola CBS 123094]|uniref:BTB domain-containing protein n=1 Tax=Amniculicola lignicola CBS 123094 TaxID=1392246 RepID=A0A6A5VSL2_9PLEO|nr:hypothetical protein P154DRAFT_540930 [Amniculicola lignicola CBS 123094]
MSIHTLLDFPDGSRLRAAPKTVSRSPYFRTLLSSSSPQPHQPIITDTERIIFACLLDFMSRPTVFPLFWDRQQGFDYSSFSRLPAEVDLYDVHTQYTSGHTVTNYWECGAPCQAMAKGQVQCLGPVEKDKVLVNFGRIVRVKYSALLNGTGSAECGRRGAKSIGEMHELTDAWVGDMWLEMKLQKEARASERASEYGNITQLLNTILPTPKTFRLQGLNHCVGVVNKRMYCCAPPSIHFARSGE